MKKKVISNPVIANDLMRYGKNKLAANLSLLGIAFNCLYLMFMYKQVCGDIKALFNDGSPVYSYIMGASVIINLIMLLVTFLSSERIKAYDKRFSIVLWVLAAIQIARIFIYPLTTYLTPLKAGVSGNLNYIFEIDTLILLIVFLVLSAASLIAAGVIGFIRANRLEKFVRDVNEGKVDLEAALKEEPDQQISAGGEVNA